MDSIRRKAEEIMKRGDAVIEQRKRRNAIIRRTAALTLGTAAVIMIGISTQLLKAPSKPTPASSGIITETSEITSTEAVTTSLPPQTSKETKTAATTTSTTITSDTTSETTAIKSTAAKPNTAIKTTVSSTKQTTANTTTQTQASSIAVTTVSVSSTITTTAAAIQTSTVTTQATTISSETTHTGYVTTIPYIPPFTKGTSTTTTNDGHYTYKLNYITIGTETVVFMKSGVECTGDLVEGKKDDTYVTGIWGESNHSENVSIYTLDGVSDNCAVIVFYPSTAECPIYINTDYSPDTLGDMLDDMGLAKHMSFGSKNVKVSGENAYYDVPTEKIMKVLGECRDAVNTNEGIAPFSRDFTIYSDISYMRYNTNIYISKEGYITTKIVDRGASFYIGEEKAQEYIEYLLGN